MNHGPRHNLTNFAEEAIVSLVVLQDFSSRMDDLMNNRVDYDYYVEDESGDERNQWSSGDEVEYNNELEDSTENFENDFNLVREDIERKRSLNEDNDFEMDDKMYGEEKKDKNETDASKKTDNADEGGPSNEDLLYDPDLDDEDEKWVERERQRHRPKKSSKPKVNGAEGQPNQEKEKEYKSDAILSCPACMITVCIDCQRHDIYKTQYRAMFVMNSSVCKDELLRYENKRKGKKRRNKDGPGKLIPADVEESKITELYNPVKCGECGTVVAVYDSDEVFHFFNVLASQA